jgi:glutamate synthase (NADPH/NADH) small chain
VTKRLLDSAFAEYPYELAKDKDVIVIGGGDTGNDCVGTCIRLGAKTVTQLEMMPQPPECRLPSNPWPEWPKVEKTDYGQQEAIKVFGADPRIYETTVKELVMQKGKLHQIKTVQVKFEDRKLVEVEGTEQLIKCDLLIIAAGFVGCEDYIAQESKVELTQRGTVKTEPDQYQTSVPKVFTAGDMHRGQSLVVWAITEGRHCAAAMDKFLMGYTPLI